MRSAFLVLALAACSSFASDPTTSAADASTTDTDASVPGVDAGALPTGALRVFVTVSGYAAPSNALQADAICRNEAKGRLPGTFRAWYSEPGAAAPSRLTTNAGKAADGPWYRLDGKRVAMNLAALTSAKTTPLENPIHLNAAGDPTSSLVWTFTHADGTVGNVCGGSQPPTIGASDFADGRWTDFAQSPGGCSAGIQLYCFQVE